jgi:hypothetical protein
VLLSLLALAVVDSINPSAIVVTLHLLGHQRVPAQVVAYVAAIGAAEAADRPALAFEEGERRVRIHGVPQAFQLAGLVSPRDDTTDDRGSLDRVRPDREDQK